MNQKITFGLVVLALLMELMWGVSFISTKYLLLAGLNASQIYIIRFGIAYCCMLAVSRKNFGITNWHDELLFLFCGLMGGSLYFITENAASNHTLVSNVGLIVTISPLLTALLSAVVMRKERISRALVIGSVTAFIGVAFVIYNSSFQIRISPLGDLLSLLAALSWAIYSVALLFVKTHRYSTIVVTRKVFFYGIVTSIPFAFMLHSDISASVFSDGWVLFNLVFLGLGASMSAFLIWNWLVKCIGAVKSSNFLYLGPIITLAASAIMLGERVTVIGYIGCVLILGGVILGEKLRF